MAEDREREEDSAGGYLRSKSANFLDVHAGFVLALGGVALIALAYFKADEAAVAPLFVVFGTFLLTAGCFYSRIEGSIEATREGFKLAVREAQRQLKDADVPPSVEEEVIERTLNWFQPRSRRWPEMRRAAERAASEAVQASEQSPAAQGWRLAHTFAAWLEDQGFSTDVSGRDVGVDVLAVKPGETMLVEVKIWSRPISVEVVRALVGMMPLKPGLESGGVRRALVVPGKPQLTAVAREAALKGSVEVYGEVAPGDFERFI